MRAIALINESYLSTEDFQGLNAKVFYCLFTFKDLYSRDSSHFLYHPEALVEKHRWLHSLKKNDVKEVIFHGEVGTANHISRELENYDIASALYFKQDSKPNILPYLLL